MMTISFPQGRLWVVFMVVTVLMAVRAGSTMAAEQALLVAEGQPRAQIVIAEDPPRLLKMAAEELQSYIEKISGAVVPIGIAPNEKYPHTIYVGESSYTRGVGITEEGLENGAFRMVSGSDYLVLLGYDFDYQPIEPWPRGPRDEAAQKKWEQVTGASWRNPISDGRLHHSELGIWVFDEGGSLTAVYEFLRSLGVRWYMPGELGEIVPEMSSIPLPEVNKTVRPDYPVRHWIHGAQYQNTPVEILMFERRMGVNSVYEALGAGQLTHGIRNVHASAAMKTAHPEYYALIGDKRDIQARGSGHACLSSQGLLQETVNYARSVLNHFNEPLIQLSPQDGFRQCECQQCIEMTPSDNVFRFLNQVASQMHRTHPDRLILGAGYGVYRDPPQSIERFSPNFAVSINNMGRPRFVDDEFWNNYTRLIESWQAKLRPNRILRVENTLYGANPVPAIHPHAIAKDLKAMQGVSMGERNEINRSIRGATHLNYYVMGRYYWDAGGEIETLLDEYYTKFYGPAADQMREAFRFAEYRHRNPEGAGAKGWFDKQKETLADQIRFWEQVHKARDAAGDTVYGQRIDVLLNESNRSVEDVRRELARLRSEGDPRADAPLIVASEADSDQAPQRYKLRNNRTGETPKVKTTFAVTWDEGELVVDVRCQEPDMENLYVTDMVWHGDTVVLLIETPYHAHYHIEVNPDGKVYDRAWGTAGGERWMSQADTETERGEDYWRVILRIPVIGTEAGSGDPYNFVVGGRPTEVQPWYVNVGRARVRDAGKTTYMFSPVIEGNFHQPEKFGRLIVE